MKESEIQATVLDAAMKMGFLVVRVKSGERGRSAAVRWNNLSGSWMGRGHPDAVLYRNGWVWFVEFKRDGKQRLRVEQDMFFAAARAAGIPCLTVFSTADAPHLLQRLRAESETT